MQGALSSKVVKYKTCSALSSGMVKYKMHGLLIVLHGLLFVKNGKAQMNETWDGANATCGNMFCIQTVEQALLSHKCLIQTDKNTP